MSRAALAAMRRAAQSLLTATTVALLVTSVATISAASTPTLNVKAHSLASGTPPEHHEFSSDKAVHVKEYTRKDGTTVKAHERKAPSPKATKAETAKAPAVAPTTAGAQPRDAKGRFVRSGSAKHAFETQTGYPHGRPGYVIDHIRALACGGADTPGNMQWQTIAEGKAKDKTERVGCR